MHKVHKLYTNYEKEQVWLNQMAGEGLAFKKYTIGTYYFEKCEPGEYQYKIEYLGRNPEHEKSKDYLGFLAENGIETVDAYINWVYLRKKTIDGPFDLYSDIDSRIAHYKRTNTLYLMTMIIEFFTSFTNLHVYISNGVESSPVNLVASIICASLLFFICLPMYIRTHLKISRLKKERAIHE